MTPPWLIYGEVAVACLSTAAILTQRADDGKNFDFELRTSFR
jgi:hypothetical protein